MQKFSKKRPGVRMLSFALALSLAAALLPAPPALSAPAAPNFPTVAIGVNATLAIDKSGDLWSWGYNDVTSGAEEGYLGVGSYAEYVTLPAKVLDAGGEPFGNVRSVAPGRNLSLALTNDGRLYAWGSAANDGGLGDGTTKSKRPKEIMPGKTFKAVTAGEDHYFAVDTDGNVWAWGCSSSWAELGLGEIDMNDKRATAAQVPDITGVESVAAGRYHTLALKTDGTVWGWGGNNYGGGNLLLTGKNGANYYVKPMQLGGLGSDNAQVAAGEGFNMILKNDGRVLTWGDGSLGRLGNGTSATSTDPGQILSGEETVRIAAYYRNGYALAADGTLYGWGYNESGSVLQEEYGNLQNSPTPIELLTGVSEVSAWNTNVIAVKSGEEGEYVWTWGANDRGQIGNGNGDGEYVYVLEPYQVKLAVSLPPTAAAPVIKITGQGGDPNEAGKSYFDLAWTASIPAAERYDVEYFVRRYWENGKANDSGDYVGWPVGEDWHGARIKYADNGLSAKVFGLENETNYKFRVVARTGSAETASNEVSGKNGTNRNKLVSASMGGVPLTVNEGEKSASAAMTADEFEVNSKILTFTLADGTHLSTSSQSATPSVTMESGEYKLEFDRGDSAHDDAKAETMYTALRFWVSGQDDTEQEYFVEITVPDRSDTVRPLASPENLTFNTNGLVGWDAVADAGSYAVQLLKDGAPVGVPVTAAVNSYDFLAAMKAAGAGTYTFSAVAKGDGVNYSDSAEVTSTADFVMRGIGSDAELPDKVLVKGGVYGLPPTVDFGAVTGVEVAWGDTLSTAAAGKFEFLGTPVNLPNDLTAAGKVAKLTVYVLDVATDKEKLYLNMSDERVSNVGTLTATLLPSEYTVTPSYLWSVTSGAGIQITGSTTASATLTAAKAGNAAAVVTVSAGEEILVKGVAVIVTEAELARLAAPAGLAFNADGAAVWEAVGGAAGYGVRLYRDGAAFGEVRETGDTYYDFLDIMRNAGTGDYSFTVIARGDDATAMDSEPGQSDSFKLESVISFNTPEDVTGIEIGAAQSDAGLPGTVTANLSGGGTAELPVTWSGWDSSAARTVTLTGTLGDLPVNIINHGNAAVPTLNVTFRARSYTVTFNANGGTVSVTNAATGADGKLAGLPTPFRSGGYRFDGWFTEANGEIQVTATTVFTSDTTVYARWTFIGGGDDGENDDDSGGGGGNIPPVPVPTPSVNQTDVDVNGRKFTVTELAEGRVEITLDEDDVMNNLGEANELTVTVSDSDDISLSLPISALEGAALRVVTDFGVAYFPAGILQTLSARYGDTLQLSVSRGSFAVELLADGRSVAYSDPANPFTVTLPYTLESGQKASAVVAVKKDGGNTVLPFAVYKNGEATFSTAATGVYDLIYNEKFFNDTDHWAADNISFVTARGLFTYTEPGSFSPDISMSRAMFATVLARLDGADLSRYAASPFTDVPAGLWYSASVAWAAEHGLVNGFGDGRFDPDAPVTREQMAVMLHKYSEYKGLSLPAGSTAAFADELQISPWALNAVKAMQSASVGGGTTGNRYDPKSTATRAEAAAVFARFVEAAAR